MMGASVLLLFYMIIKDKKHGKEAGKNPWDAFTLEWYTQSPPPLKNFDEVPAINSPLPLWEIKYGKPKDNSNEKGQ